MNIRPARLEDLPELLEIYNDAIQNLTATFDLEPQTLEERKLWFEAHDENYPLIVAEIDGKVAGYCSLSPYRPKKAYRQTTEISIYLNSSFRGHGIGKQLMTEIIKQAKQLNFHAIIAIITGGNEVSVKLHERFGFQFMGYLKEVGFKFDEWQDVHFYQLLLK